MSDECTPGEAELVRWFRPPPVGTVERRDGESFADYLSRASIETHESQMDHEAQARCGIAKVKADAQTALLDRLEALASGFHFAGDLSAEKSLRGWIEDARGRIEKEDER